MFSDKMSIYCFSIIILAGLFTFGECKVYKPCELAQEVYSLINDKLKAAAEVPSDNLARVFVDYMNDIPLIVCIAGYHNFSTESSYSLSDGKIRDGLFGIILEKSGESYRDDDIEDDLWALINVLYIGNYKNTLTHEFYSKACTPRHTRMVYCYLNKYVFGSYQVWAPKNPMHLQMVYQDPAFG